MWIRGAARLTRNPPNLRLRGGPDDDAQSMMMAERAAAGIMYQWDRSESQRAFKAAVKSSYAFGWGVTKTYWDNVTVVRRLRKLTKTLTKGELMSLKDSSDPEIAAAMEAIPDEMMDQSLTDAEVSQALVDHGDSAMVDAQVKKYSGPVLANIFIGDIYPESGFRSLNDSAEIIENSIRDEDWLKYWQNQVSIDPRTGEEKKVFDNPQLCQKLLDRASGERNSLDEKELTLRRWMRDEVNISDPKTAGKPQRHNKKRFMVDERHTMIDGYLCIDFVGEEADYLGRLWYPWETYGKPLYHEIVLIPDFLGGIGLSTLKVTKYLLQLKNTRQGQITDYINNVLLPFFKTRKGADIDEYNVIRTGMLRVLELENPNDAQMEQMAQLPASAWQDMAVIDKEMQDADPASVDYAPGSSDQAGVGKFATTAKLQANASDSVTADLLDNLGMGVRDIAEMWLWLDQQGLPDGEKDGMKVPKQYFERIDALSIRGENGNAKTINVSAMDFQNEYEILPEQGSTLAADDEFRVGALLRFAQAGAAHPDIVNLREVFTQLAKATPGVSPEKIILPPPPPAPKVPPVKATISIAIKYDELPADVKAKVLGELGLPTELTHVEGMGDVIKHASDAADAASNLEKPAHEEPAAPPKKK
jgi:hypothetical protein